MNPYETQGYLNEYLLFHFGSTRQRCPFPSVPRNALRFHERIVPECLLPIKFPHPTEGLDIGCAVGRLTFELARKVDHVTGIDNAHLLIDAARRIARTGRARVKRRELGDSHTRLTLILPKKLSRGNVTFKVGDALNIQHSPVHVVAAINLICRLPNPRKFLKQLPGLVLPGGQLILGSPHTWRAEFTSRRRWLTQDDILDILTPDFRLVRRKDLPFLIRETQRKYQWVVSDVMTLVRLSD